MMLQLVQRYLFWKAGGPIVFLFYSSVFLFVILCFCLSVFLCVSECESIFEYFLSITPCYLSQLPRAHTHLFVVFTVLEKNTVAAVISAQPGYESQGWEGGSVDATDTDSLLAQAIVTP